MKTQALVNQTESWVQQELNAQRHLLELLDAQEQAILAGSGEGITASGDRIQAQLRAGPLREQRRRGLMQAFSRLWGVAPDTLTLRSIIDRAEGEGASAANLRRLREELRDVGARVLRKGRRIAAMARYHQGLLGELLELLLTDTTGDAGASLSGREGGVLVNQEA